jgi:hypothetical protein
MYLGSLEEMRVPQLDSPMNIPDTAKSFIAEISQKHGTEVELREILTGGKSGAFVALVDCLGAHDGVYILKVAEFPVGKADEEARHKQALQEGAFSGNLPAIILSERSSTHYCLLIKIAGQSRIAWRPLVAALRLFRSTYIRFGTLAWTPRLFKFGPLQSPSSVVSEAIGYKLLESKGGRIAQNVSRFIGTEFLHRPLFLHNGQLLPNPYYFANTTNVGPVLLRPLLGPVHGDCHYQNLFVKPSQDASVADVQLIDLATYQSHSLYFFDHAYLELAIMLRQMDELGDRRWLQLVTALSRDGASFMLQPDERGWLEDVLEARKHTFALVSECYPDRMDDLKLQFLLAQVAVGLAFLHKTPRQGHGSGGLSESQYRQSFVWASVFLNEFLKSLSLHIESAFPNENEVWPAPGLNDTQLS